MKYVQSFRKGIWMLFVLLLVGETSAQQISQKEAIKAAVSSLIMRYPEKAASFSEASVCKVFSLTDKGNCLVHEVCFKNGKRVFLSGNKSCLPVLGYVDFCTIDSSQMESALSFGEEVPDGLKLFLNDYAEQNRYCFDNNVEDENIKTLWDVLQQEKMDKATTVVIIPPLITTQWGQSYSNDATLSWIDYNAYNYYVQEGTGCSQHCYAGCGAVAMAQIMKYWNEPTDIPARCTQYDWNNMPDKLFRENNNNYTDQRHAVATLIHECGVESGMHYCIGSSDPCSSGNTIYGANTGFHNYGFTNATVVSRVSNDNDWISRLYDELYDNRPIYYTGYETSSGENGHAFVCDGYYKDENNNQFFHFNWGWRGNYDGYYTISNLNPDHYVFNYHHRVICGIYPTNCWQDIIMECDKTFSSGSMKFYATSSKFWNNYHNYVINSGANVLLQADEEIYLTDGFYAAAGSEFIAYLAPCGNVASMDDEGIRGREASEVLNDSLWQEMGCPNQNIFQASSKDMVIYPNPVTGTFSIRLGNPSEKVESVEVYNVMGGKVLSQFNTTTEGFDASSFQKGMYILTVKCTSGNVYFGKFVKE